MSAVVPCQSFGRASCQQSAARCEPRSTASPITGRSNTGIHHVRRLPSVLPAALPPFTSCASELRKNGISRDMEPLVVTLGGCHVRGSSHVKSGRASIATAAVSPRLGSLEAQSRGGHADHDSDLPSSYPSSGIGVLVAIPTVLSQICLSSLRLALFGLRVAKVRVQSKSKACVEAVSSWMLLVFAALTAAQLKAKAWLKSISTPSVAPPQSTSQQLLCSLQDEHSTHEDRLAKIKDIADADEFCFQRVNDLVSNTGLTAGAVNQLVELGLARGLSPKAIEKVIYKMASSDVDAETALRQAFVAMFMGCSSGPGYRVS